MRIRLVQADEQRHPVAEGGCLVMRPLGAQLAPFSELAVPPGKWISTLRPVSYEGCHKGVDGDNGSLSAVRARRGTPVDSF
jgi:hypothetical protein